MKTVKVPNYDASPRQTLFHTSQCFETFYGGAAGGGKTAALVAEAVTLCLEYPGIPIYIFRRTIPELKSSIVPEVRRQCADYIALGKLTYNGQDREFRFDNGSIIKLAYLDHPGDEFRYQGSEIPVALFDELTHFTKDQYEYIKTRVRTSNPDWPLKVMAASNPGNVGHGWVKDYFLDGKVPEHAFVDPKTNRTRIFIPAKVDDHPNKKFREDYSKTLEAIADTDLRRALRDGDWDVFAGQAFTEWARDKDSKPWHVVTPFTIPEHWQKWMAYDYGYNTYAAAVWLAKDPQSERIYVYREYYVSQRGITDQSSDILLYDQGENVAQRLADPAMWKSPANADTGETASDMFAKNGVFFIPANNERLAGKAAVHDALKTAPDGLPYLQVFSSCVNIIRTLPVLPYSKTRPEDIDTDAEDHLYDALRYALANSRPQERKEAKVVGKFDQFTGRRLD
jgi:hypothetical protein